MAREDAAQIFRTYNKSLYNTALRLTASSADSQEIVQETLCRYLMRAPRMKEEAVRAKWLRTTCVRLSIDFLRREKRFVSLDKMREMDEEASSGLAHGAGGEVRGTKGGASVGAMAEDGGNSWEDFGADAMGLVMEEIAALPDGQRAVLVLKAVEDYEYSEIAKMLSISESTARSQFLRARRRVCENVLKRAPQ